MKRDRKPNPFAVSDRLTALLNAFSRHSGGPISISASGVSMIIGEITQILAAARALESKMSMMEWNRLGHGEMAVDAAGRPGSNVVLLDAASRTVRATGGENGNGRAS